ncbi:hypothetical protein CH370_16830 [Leptospira kmetyi]|uniref:hypothetical protein n=1 Tax=Leptospira kmetyi TaxID=408139 RepID=UPI000C2A69CF|nr:hypothetical protein [Leptospira kmetyi]PJZ40180.1 hypothetical protein CH370_16830 [Leptospira kmetyi]
MRLFSGFQTFKFSNSFYIFRKSKRISVVYLLFVLTMSGFCKPARIDNDCDPNSSRFQTDTILRAVFGPELGILLKTGACRPSGGSENDVAGPGIRFDLTAVRGGGLQILEKNRNRLKGTDVRGELYFNGIAQDEEYSFEIAVQPEYQTCTIAQPSGVFRGDATLTLSCSPLIATSEYIGGDQTYPATACVSMTDVTAWNPIVLNLRTASRVLVVYNGFFKTNSDPFALLRQGIEHNGNLILTQDRRTQISSAEFSSTNSRILDLPAGLHTFVPKVCSDSFAPVLAGGFKSTFSVIALDTLSTYADSSFAQSSSSSTNSASTVPIAGLNTNLNLTSDSPVFISLHLNAPLGSTGTYYYPSVVSDSLSVESNGTFNFMENSSTTSSSLFALKSFAAGSHSFEARWRTQGPSNPVQNQSYSASAPSVLNAIRFKSNLNSQMLWRSTGWDASSADGYLDVSNIPYLELIAFKPVKILFFLQANNYKSSNNRCKVGVERNGYSFATARMNAPGTNFQNDPITILTVENVSLGYHSFAMRYWSENGALCEFPGVSNTETGFGYLVLE